VKAQSQQERSARQPNYSIKDYNQEITMKRTKITAIYLRVSSTNQNTASQRLDLDRWVESTGLDAGSVAWYEDRFTGRTMDRPAWNRLYSDIQSNKVASLVVWRLDRLGRTASGLTKLFEELQSRKVRFVSVKDAIDLGTAAGRLIANVLASVSSYETEIRSERIQAGITAAKASGKRWGGSTKGRLLKTTPEQVRQIVKMKADGERVSTIVRATGISWPTYYRVLRRVEDGDIKVAV
jgi:DNA invertase Pin-like site-specific DNA recombinase